MKRVTGIMRRRDDAKDIWLGALTLFGILFSHTLLETARDALFLGHLPISHLPLMYIAIAVYLFFDLARAVDNLPELAADLRALLSSIAREVAERNTEVTLRLLAVAEGHPDFAMVRRNLRSRDNERRSASLELIDQHLQGSLRDALEGLIDAEVQMKRGKAYYQRSEPWSSQEIRKVLEGTPIPYVRELAKAAFMA